jgi:hypothetical protein
MTRRERLRRCYFHEVTDRPAVYSRTAFPADDATYDHLKAYLEIHTELKAGWSVQQFESPYPVETSVEPHSEDFQRRTEVLHTPKGDLRRSFLESRHGEPGLHETFFVNSPQDAEKFLSLPLPQLHGAVDSFFGKEAAIGDGGIVDVKLGFNPGGYVAELCGSTNFALMSIEDRDVLHSLCERQMGIVLQRVKFLLDNGVGPFFSIAGQEYIVPPLHGPKDFSDFNTRYDKPIIDLIHDAGGRVHVHSHGSIKSVFPGFVEMGADVLHPFEPPPMGDILAHQAKSLARGRICLEGNIQIHRMYESTPEEIRQETAQLIHDAFDDHRGLIVCPSASPYIRGQGEKCFPQYQAMVETVLEFKG